VNRKFGNYKVRAFDLDVKSVAEGGIFTGYGSVFGVVDSYREVVAPGAFKKSLAELVAKGRSLPILWQHRQGEPIGSWTNLKEDAHGLIGDGELWLDDSEYARLAYRGMKSKSITGLSIGYYVIDDSYNEATRVRTLKELELVEISIVTTPANDEARIEAVKTSLAHGTLPNEEEFKSLLLHNGFTRYQASSIAEHGLKHLLQAPAGADAQELSALVAQASSFSLSSLSF
jgi:HK97 family phage prohead protease